MYVDIVQHLEFSFDEYMREAKMPIEELTEALVEVLKEENDDRLREAIASDDFQNRKLINAFLPVYREDPTECERRLRKVCERARDTYLETAGRKLGWRTAFKFTDAVQSSEPEKLNLGLDTKHRLLQVSLSEELLSRLPRAVSRATLLLDWAVKEASSPAADQYLSEACNCFLYELDTACVAMCRSLLEEVIERKFHVFLATQQEPKGGWTLGSLWVVANRNKSQLGLDDGLLDLLTLVKKAGNDAAHGKIVTQAESLSCLKNCHAAITILL